MMQSTSFILLLCGMVTLSWACCTPDQWEGEQFTISGYAAIFRRGLLREYNYVAYDATNNRSAIFMKYYNGDVEAKLQIVKRYDGNGGKLYVENLDKKKCWTKELKGEFRKACIPDDAHAYGDFYLGLDGGYKVSGYRVECKHITAGLTVQPVEEGVCAPIGEMITGKMAGYDVLTQVGFTGITPGIKNETVFDVPKDCEDMRTFDLPVEVLRDHYILAL